MSGEPMSVCFFTADSRRSWMQRRLPTHLLTFFPRALPGRLTMVGARRSVLSFISSGSPPDGSGCRRDRAGSSREVN